jgi:protein O-mannosyl-transferase
MPTSQGTLSSEKTQQKNLIPILICLALAILTVITFWSLKDCGFISLDDNAYVYENAYVQSGLNWNSIGQAFSSELAKVGHWHPLTWLSLMLDYQIFGLNPSGFHLINLLFHVMNTILLFLIFRRMTKTLWPSAFVAALFAIHPLHVESVAWITERKDVLSTFFWMLTMGAYSYYVEHPRFRRYFLVLMFFILGLMAKSILVTLPFVLLLLDYWPLQRFQEIKPEQKIQAKVFNLTPSVKETLEVEKPADTEYKWSLIYPLLLEKVPLFVLAVLSSIVTYLTAQSAGAVGFLKTLPLSARIENAFVSYIAYIGKMIWPNNLAVFYPYPKLLVPLQVIGSVFLLIAITLVVFWRAKKFPYLATGWLWYIGTLVPVIGLVQVGSQAMADRYTYLSSIGIAIMLAWGMPLFFQRLKIRKKILFSAAIAVLCVLVVSTWMQCGYWKNSLTLFSHALQVTKDNYLAHNNLGLTLFTEGNTEEAIYHYNKAIRIKPNYTYAYNNRGVAYNKLGQYQRAIEDYNEAIRQEQDSVSYYNRGIAYNNLGQYQRAIEDYNEAIRQKPDVANAYNNRGIAYNNLGQYQRAIEDYNEAIRQKPDVANAYNNRGFDYLKQGNKNLGCRDAQKACALGNCKTLEWARGKEYCR